MANSIDAAEYSVPQLRAWLQQLNISSSGNKAALIIRLNELSPEERGECPRGDALNEPEKSQYARENVADETELLRRELEVQRRKIELLRRESTLLQREQNITTVGTSPSTTGEASGVTSPTSFNVLRDLMPEFDGNNDFDVWFSQMMSLRAAYVVDENVLRTLLFSKLKGRALAWLHSRPNFATETFEELTRQLKGLFSTRESKLLLRRKFELRVWKHGESFADYYHDKLVGANKLNISESEVIDYLIDGIPDEQLKTQAYMQCYETKTQLLQAFLNIQLRRQTNSLRPVVPKLAADTGATQSQSATKFNIRCYNCNALGHYAAECRKSKREVGACFVCGDRSHHAAACSKRKNVVMMVENNYDV